MLSPFLRLPLSGRLAELKLHQRGNVVKKEKVNVTMRFLQIYGSQEKGHMFCLVVSNKEELSSNFLLTFKNVQRTQDSRFQSLFAVSHLSEWNTP